MTFALVAETFKAGSSSGPGTTSAIDTTGADLIVIATSWYGSTANYNSNTLSDSEGNTWTLINEIEAVAGCALWYCYNPSTNASHTFSLSSAASTFSSIGVLAFSGAAASPLDQANENSAASSATVQPGSVTPTEDNELVVTCHAQWNSGDAATIDGGFTIPSGHSIPATTSVRTGLGDAYLIQTTASAANPTWDWTNSASGPAVIATFKAAAAPSSGITLDEQGQTIYQRDFADDQASVTLAGTYAGSPASIEYRLLAYADDSTVVDWTTLDASPSSNAFSVAVDVDAGGMYYAEVRFSDDTGVTASQSDPWGVGDIILSSGQSSARNCFASTGTAYDPTMWFWSTTTSSHSPTGEWKQLTTDSHGAIGFADAWVAVTGFPIGFIDAGVGSSAAATWQGGGTNYAAAKVALDANGSTLACNWYWQGEAEAGAGATQAAYEDDLYNDANSVIKQYRSDFTNPTDQAQIPFVVMLLGRNGTVTDANAQAIRDAQIAVADAAAGVYRVTIHDLTLQDTIHYTTTSYGTAGARAAQAGLYGLGLVAYHRGPQIAYAVQVDASTVDVYLTHDGGTDITPTSAINGFEVFDDASPVTISTAVRQAADIVRLGLAAPISGTLTLRHFYGADGGVTFANAYTNPLVDNSALALPVENAESITVTDPPSVPVVVLTRASAIISSGVR